MSSPFGELTGRAQQLVAAGDLSGAQELLADALADADPRPANASPELAEAAGLQARVLVALGDAQAARAWAAFAHAATTRLHGTSDQRTVAAAATLAAVLHRVGNHARAAQLYEEVILELTALDGPESLRVLAAHADLATVEYARGDCTIARERLQDAWELHREVYGDGHVSGIRMLARLGAMQRDCGHFTDAFDNLALARELCRQHLEPDDPLAAQIAGLARATADPDHTCDRVVGAPTPSVPVDPDDSAWPPEPAWPPDPAMGADPASAAGYPDTTAGYPDTGTAAGSAAAYAGTTAGYPDTGTDAGASAAADDPGTAVPAPPAGDPYRDAADGHPVDQRQPADGGYPVSADHTSVPRPRTPPGETGSTDERGYDRWAATGRYDSDPTDDTWWPPEEDVDRAAVPNGRPESSTVVDRRPEPPTQEAPGVHRVANLPVPRGSRLPVPVPRPAATPNRRLAPLVVAGVVVALLGTGAVIAGVARVDQPVDPPPVDGPSGTPGPDATASPEVSPGGVGAPPSGVSLRDDRDTVTLTWTYPTGAEGPVVVSGGRVGQDQRAYQELPAGATNYIVYGLDQGTDYCFTVTVVHSTEVVGRAEPVCTKRG